MLISFRFVPQAHLFQKLFGPIQEIRIAPPDFKNASHARLGVDVLGYQHVLQYRHARKKADVLVGPGNPQPGDFMWPQLASSFPSNWMDPFETGSIP